jgi:hypothetical protein
VRVTGRVHWGKGAGWIYSTLAVQPVPVPLVRVGGLLAKLVAGFTAEFESRSTVWSWLISLSTTPTTSIWTQQTRQEVFKGKLYICNPPAIFFPTSFILFRFLQRELVATRPLPSNKGCRPHDTNVDGFRVGVQLCMGFWEGRKQEGRPMVWETRKVRREMNQVGSPPFTYFLHCLLTSKTCQDVHRPLTHLTTHAVPP